MSASHPDAHPSQLAVWLTSRLSFYLDRQPHDIRPTTPLADYGLDSVAVLGLCGDIEDRYGLEVEPTMAYDHPTVSEIAGHLAELLADRPTGAEVPR